MIVVDNDVLCYFWLKQTSGRTEAARKARRRDAEWVAPRLWRSEFRNVLRRYMVANLLTYSEALWYVQKAERDMQGREYDVPSAEVLKLVAQSGHSAYDCEYVALAQSLNVSLLTGDQQLVQTFPRIAVLLGDFATA